MVVCVLRALWGLEDGWHARARRAERGSDEGREEKESVLLANRKGASALHVWLAFVYVSFVFGACVLWAARGDFCHSIIAASSLRAPKRLPISCDSISCDSISCPLPVLPTFPFAKVIHQR